MSEAKKEAYRTKRRAYYYENHEECKRIARESQLRNKQNKRVSDKAWYERHKQYANEQSKRHRERLRLRVIAAYGGACACCGEDGPAFLAIDHIHNDGRQDRKERGLIGTTMYRWLEKNGYPRDRYQLLCHNCNMTKGFYGNCPHSDFNYYKAGISSGLLF